MACALLLALLGSALFEGPVGAHSGAEANTFGSVYNEDPLPVAERLMLADHPVQEWSVSTWSFNPATWAFDDVINQALEDWIEPTDLVINRGTRNSTQDELFFPHADPMLPAFTTRCWDGVAAVYGTHPHRVCDKKLVFININAWSELSNLDQRYVAAHEFGHTLGLRHSNHSGDVHDIFGLYQDQGVSVFGWHIPSYNTWNEATFMHTFGFGT